MADAFFRYRPPEYPPPSSISPQTLRKNGHWPGYQQILSNAGLWSPIRSETVWPLSSPHWRQRKSRTPLCVTGETLDQRPRTPNSESQPTSHLSDSRAGLSWLLVVVAPAVAVVVEMPALVRVPVVVVALPGNVSHARDQVICFLTRMAASHWMTARLP